MAEPTGATSVAAPGPGPDATPRPRPEDATTGDLVGRLTAQTSELVRNELALAKAEMTTKGKQAGVGAGLLGGAGVVALYGVGALVAAAILALALLVPAWLSALIVAVLLFVVAGIVALLGKKRVARATPAAPQRTIDNVKRDVATLKGGGTS